jgi:GNAT superfamily N-acetyltransferase
VPPELRNVPARREHHGDFARFFAELHSEDPLPDADRWLVEMAPGTFFLAEGDELLGYTYCETYGERGYVRHVVVAPQARGRGVGNALMRALARRFTAAGCKRWELNVHVGNDAAIGLYERWGMREEYRTSVLRLPWDGVARLPKGARSTVARPVDVADDAGIEQRFGLPQGQVARLREFSGTYLIQLVERGEPVAFSRFDPRFPGSFPFRLESPELARPLLEATRSYARPEDTWIQLVVEDDAATAEALRAAGAQPKIAILHMSGVIPAA